MQLIFGAVLRYPLLGRALRRVLERGSDRSSAVGVVGAPVASWEKNPGFVSVATHWGGPLSQDSTFMAGELVPGRKMAVRSGVLV